MAAPDLLLGDLAALGPQPRDVRLHDQLVELGQVVGAAPADLDVADEQLGQVEPAGAPPQNPKSIITKSSPWPPAIRLLGQASPWLSR